MKYLYENHLVGLYISDEKNVFKERYKDPYHFGKIIGDYTITNKTTVLDVNKEKAYTYEYTL